MALMAKTILWVDDEAELLEPHRLLLGDKGYHVETATNADDALELLRRRPYDLVLLDELEKDMPTTNRKWVAVLVAAVDVRPVLFAIMVQEMVDLAAAAVAKAAKVVKADMVPEVRLEFILITTALMEIS